MEKKTQTQLLIGIATGAVAATAGYLTYDRFAASSIGAAGTPSYDAKYFTCDGASSMKMDTKALYDTKSNTYSSGTRVLELTANKIDSNRIFKSGASIYKNDGNKYTANSLPLPLDPGALLFQDSNGTIYKSDGKILSSVAKDGKYLKTDTEVYRTDISVVDLSAGTFMVWNNQNIICLKGKSDGKSKTNITGSAVGILQVDANNVLIEMTPYEKG